MRRALERIFCWRNAAKDNYGDSGFARMTAWALAAAMCSACGVCVAQQAFVPKPPEAGVIRSWGDDAMRATMAAWEQGFRRYHPEITFEDKLMGTATSMAGIITSTSDLSLMGRPVTVNEVIGFEWVFRVKPLGIQVMNGSLKAEGKSPALAVFVSRGNPLKEISVAQLAAVLGCPAAAHERATWGAAGATGAWKDKPVHAFLYDDQTGTGAFLQQAIEGTKDCWNWEIVREFKDVKRADGSVYPAGQQIVEALKRDPDGLAISTLSYAGPEVKALAVDGVELTPESVAAGKYPLGRGVYIYINRAKDKPVDAKVDEFLRYVLSPEGQAVVRKQGDFISLSARAAAQELTKLE
jgi:phosphate transport system substrate-binding protein